MTFIKSVYAVIKNPLLPNSEDITSNPENYTNNTLQAIITVFLIVAVIYFVWHFIMAAYHMISSNGDPKKWEESQRAILYSLVGIILAFSVFAILKFAGTLFGIPSLQNLQLTWPSL
jgi:hypothetical protein